MAKHFTQEEIEILRANQYTLSVSEKTIKHTLNFKEVYWQMYNQGIGPTIIFRKCGYDTKMLGKSRIIGFSQHIKQEYDKYGYFRESKAHNTSRPPRDTNYEKMKEKQAMKAMQTELTYLRQEVDFLKKLIKLERE